MNVICVPNAGKMIESAREKIAVPCKDCKSRSLGCHSACAAYAEYKEQVSSLKRKIYGEYNSERPYQGVIISGKLNVIARRRKK